MNKWFESNNLASYAKTALAQAQKKIDQVLDIKEEDIVAQGGSGLAASSSSSQFASPFTAKLNELSSDTAGTKSRLGSSSASSLTGKAEAAAPDADSFFSTFLNQPSVPSQKDSAASFFFSVANSATSGSESKPTAVTATHHHDDQLEISTSATSSTATLDDRSVSTTTGVTAGKTKKPAKSPRSHIQVQQQQQQEDHRHNQSSEADRIEKQNWIQDFVNASGSSNSSSTVTASADPSVVSSTSSILTVTTKQSGNELDIKTSFFEGDHNLASPTSVNSYKIIGSDTVSEAIAGMESEKKEAVEVGGESSMSNNMVTSSGTDIDFVKVDGTGSSASGCSSTEEGLETNASSDIEVLSLPSNHGDQLLAMSRSGGKVPSLASIAGKQSKAVRDTTAPHHGQSKPPVSSLKNNVKLIKSPPPPNENNNLGGSINVTASSQQAAESSQQQQTVTMSSAINSTGIVGPSSGSSDIKTVLDAREAHILKLNKANVKLQEDNDNLLSDIEKLKSDVNDKCAFYQQTANELAAKCELLSGERDYFKKMSNDMQQELTEAKGLLREREQQAEQLVQEGMKLSKQELNQSNIIKKLRAKEKESDEVLSILK
jgi:hypothetical protein